MGAVSKRPRCHNQPTNFIQIHNLFKRRLKAGISDMRAKIDIWHKNSI